MVSEGVGTDWYFIHWFTAQMPLTAQGWAKLSAEAYSIQLFQEGNENVSTKTLICCLPGCSSRKLDWKQRYWYSDQHSIPVWILKPALKLIGDASVPSGSLPVAPSFLPLFPSVLWPLRHLCGYQDHGLATTTHSHTQEVQRKPLLLIVLLTKFSFDSKNLSYTNLIFRGLHSDAAG